MKEWYRQMGPEEGPFPVPYWEAGGRSVRQTASIDLHWPGCWSLPRPGCGSSALAMATWLSDTEVVEQPVASAKRKQCASTVESLTAFLAALRLFGGLQAT